MTFWLGAPEPSWLAVSRRPLMVSHNRLRRLRSMQALPVAYTPWLLDSGAYDVITRHGRFPDDPQTYALAVRRYARRVGQLVWAAPQDYPCEAEALAATGATPREHGRLSARSYVELTQWWERLAPKEPSPFRPVLQGWDAADYLWCWDEFARLGVDLAGQPVIAVGSMCRREHTADIGAVVAALRQRTTGRLHGYGVKDDAVDLFDDVDSMGWSAAARWRGTKHPACTAWHRSCVSCLVEAEAWHDERLRLHPRHDGRRTATPNR